MSSTILSKIHQLDSASEEQVKSCFDEMMSKIPADDHQSLVEIVNALIPISSKCLRFLDHPFFIHLRSTFVSNLEKATDNDHLSHGISAFLSELTNHTNDENVQFLHRFFADSNLTACLAQSLTNLSGTCNHYLISSIEQMLDAYQKFQDDRPDIQNDPILSTLIMPIVNFVKSTEYQSSFFQLSPEQKQFNSFQKLILVRCPTYINTYWGDLQKEIVSAIVQLILTRSAEILEHFLPSIDKWQVPVIWSIYQLILLCQRCANEHLLLAYDLQHATIQDYLVKIVQSKELWSLANEESSTDDRAYRSKQLFCYSTLYIYTTTFLSQLRDKLKEKNIFSILLQLTEAKYDKTQFHAYRALAAVLTDEDIKQLANPAKITAVFILYMKKSIDVIVLRQRMGNLLLSLQLLMQHDQIRMEFLRQTDGLPLLFRCATESQFAGTQIQLRSLKLLMTLTFNNKGKALLEKEKTFLEELRKLSSSRNSAELQKIADGILWRLFPKAEKTERKFQYDVMISYSHRDKDICHQIHRALVADHFRVWIDLERMQGIMMQSMAEAVEQSRCILICMSDNYSISPYCQAEAQYAFEKRRLLIPLRVQAVYKPQGWLAFTVTGRMYVDFIKLNFEAAYSQLIAQFRQNQIGEKELDAPRSPPANIKDLKPVVEKKERVVYIYPEDVLQWTPDNVRDFLLDQQLTEMIPVCRLMDGERLIDLYRLCCQNSPLMLQTLRSEAKESNIASLSTNTYLAFLNQMKKRLPKQGSTSDSTAPSRVFTWI